MPNVTLIGFDDFQEKLAGLSQVVLDEVNEEVIDAAHNWEERAKLDAPVDKGFLRAGITSKQDEFLTAEVNSNALYSAYVEWGTGTRVKVPADLADYAIQFKGTKSIIGQFPHPFFFVQRPLIEKEFIENLNRILNRPY